MNLRCLFFLAIALLALGSKHLPAEWSQWLPITVVQTQLPGAWILHVEESSERTPASARLLQDEDFKAGLTTRGLNFRHYDVSDQPGKQFVLAAQKVGLPAIVIIDAAGKVVESVHLDDTTDVPAFVRKVTGL